MAVIVIRLHPDKPTNGDTFQTYLEGLDITVADRSFADPKGTVNVLGTASYIAEGDPNATIVQHWVPPPPALPLFRAPAATAAIEIPDPLYQPEYLAPDLVLTVTRTVAPNPTETIITHDINFNVDLAPSPLPPSDPAAYALLGPVALYLPIPKVALAPGVAYLDVPTDGTPLPFQAVHDAVVTVLNADPGAPLPDLTALTVEQCRHIALEIVSDRSFDPLPQPSLPLEQLYLGGNETERQQFEANLLTFYSVHGTRADVLAKFIFSMSAALACEQMAHNATQVGFTMPILPGIAPAAGRVAETTVVISQ